MAAVPRLDGRGDKSLTLPPGSHSSSTKPRALFVSSTSEVEDTTYVIKVTAS